jgi:hypothetical protein
VSNVPVKGDFVTFYFKDNIYCIKLQSPTSRGIINCFGELKVEFKITFSKTIFVLMQFVLCIRLNFLILDEKKHCAESKLQLY